MTATVVRQDDGTLPQLDISKLRELTIEVAMGKRADRQPVQPNDALPAPEDIGRQRLADPLLVGTLPFGYGNPLKVNRAPLADL